MNAYQEALDARILAAREHDALPTAQFKRDIDLYLVHLMSTAIREGDTFYWSDAIARIVLASSLTMPEEATLSLDDIPSPLAWHFFERPITIADRTIKAIACGAATSDQWPTCNEIIVCKSMNEALLGNGVALALNSRYFSDRPPISKAIYAFMVAICAWLKQRVVVVSREPVERHTRKRLARADIIASDIKVVTLRRPEPRSLDGQAGATREYSCQWLVSAHWRQQWYPAEGRHRLKLIPSYVKGPADKPLKEPTDRVYAVIR